MDEEQLKDVVLGQFDKVSRTKARWKVQLKVSSSKHARWQPCGWVLAGCIVQAHVSPSGGVEGISGDALGQS